MPSLESLQKEIEELKKQNQSIIGFLSTISENKNNIDLGNLINQFSNNKKESAKEADVFVEKNNGGDEALIIDQEPEKLKKDETWAEKEVEEINKVSTNFEEKIGIKFFSRLGIIALVVGIGFFIKYVNDNNLIGYLGRIMIGVFSGIALIVLGEVAARTKKYVNWGKVLIGGGLATVYFSVYAAYNFIPYREAIGISQGFDIVLLIIVALITGLFAIKDNSQIIAVEAFLLGFVTSLLSSDFGSLMLVYNLIWTLLLILVAYYKNWALISAGGALGTYITYGVWRTHNYESGLMALAFLGIYFLCYVLQSLLFTIRTEEDKKKEKYIAIANVLNSSLFFFFGYEVVMDRIPEFDASFCFLLGAFHLAASWFSHHFKKINTACIYFYFGMAFLSVGIPLWFDKSLITVVWSALCLVMLLLYFKFKYRHFEYAFYLISIVTAIKVVCVDSFLEPFSEIGFGESTRILAYSFAILCFYACYFLIYFNKEKISQSFKNVALYFYSFCPTFLLVILIPMETEGDWNKTFISWLLVFLAVSLLPFLNNLKEFKEFRIQGPIISILFIFKFLFDIGSNEIGEDLQMILYLMCIISFYGVSAFWYVKRNLLEDGYKFFPVLYGYIGMAAVTTFVYLNFEGYWISVGWAVVALAAILLGFMFSKKEIRHQGIILIILTVLKVFLYDTSDLETIYRTISFTVLGAVLLSASFLYNKYKDKIKDIL